MKLKAFITSTLFLGVFLAPAYASAQVPLFKDVCRDNKNRSSVCEDARQGRNANPLYGPNGVITVIVNLLSALVGIAAVIGIIVAGIKYITSASNPEEANKSRELVIYAVVGLVLATIAQVLVRAVLHNIGV